MKKFLFVSLVFLLLTSSVLAADSYVPLRKDIAKIDGLPPIGKWMISPDNLPANWIGELYNGKNMQEPINVIIIDNKAASIIDAKDRLSRYMRSAGFKNRGGHSSGYKGYMNDKLYAQIPPEKDHAYSDGWYIFDNDHARLFGPYKDNNRYIFIGAFSREIVGLYGKTLTHKYGSFNKARDAFASKVKQRTDLKNYSLVKMGSKLENSKTTTGDHDGEAVLLTN
jgi:hypothetical protein